MIGAQGYLGSNVYKALLPYYPDLIGTHHSGKYAISLEKPEINFSLEGYRYALIAAGIRYIHVCEDDYERSHYINVEKTLELGKNLVDRGVIPIFCSTDYVFDGQQEIYKTTCPTSPMNAYGRLKAELEQKASELGALTVRISKIYGLKKGDKTLFDVMADSFMNNKPIQAAVDQVFAPITIDDVVSNLLDLLRMEAVGIQHIAGPTFATRIEMARSVAKALGKSDNLIIPVSISNFDHINRPKKVILRASLPALSWEEGVQIITRQYLHENNSSSLSQYQSTS